MNPDPESRDALEYLEDWHRLGLTGPPAPATPSPGQPRMPTTPVLTGVAALDELLKAAVTPARRRRWWWPW